MNENLTGCFAKSKAGHDKGELYVVVKCDDEYVWLSDGRLKPVDKPKKKKRKHVQPINEIAINIEETLKIGGQIADENIRKELRKYRQSLTKHN